MVDLPDPSEYDDLDKVAPIRNTPRTPKPRTTQSEKKKEEAVEEKTIVPVNNDQFHTRQRTYFVAFDTDDKLKLIARMVEDKTGNRIGKGKVIDEIVATFGDEYLRLKLKSS